MVGTGAAIMERTWRVRFGEVLGAAAEAARGPRDKSLHVIRLVVAGATRRCAAASRDRGKVKDSQRGDRGRRAVRDVPIRSLCSVVTSRPARPRGVSAVCCLLLRLLAQDERTDLDPTDGFCAVVEGTFVSRKPDRICLGSFFSKTGAIHANAVHRTAC